MLSQVYVGNTPLENVYSFEYLGARMQCDGTDDADVRYRMAIAQPTFGSLSSIWTDHRLSRALKLRTYQVGKTTVFGAQSENVNKCSNVVHIHIIGAATCLFSMVVSLHFKLFLIYNVIKDIYLYAGYLFRNGHCNPMISVFRASVTKYCSVTHGYYKRIYLFKLWVLCCNIY